MCRSRRELSNEYSVFTCKIWLRYRRERALYSLPALRVQIAQVLRSRLSQALPPCKSGQCSNERYRFLHLQDRYYGGLTSSRSSRLHFRVENRLSIVVGQTFHNQRFTRRCSQLSSSEVLEESLARETVPHLRALRRGFGHVHP